MHPTPRPAPLARGETGALPSSLARPIAFGGLAVFIGALLYFAFRYMSGFGGGNAGPADIRAALTDVALFSAFAFHHSLFARDMIRKRITRMVGTLERSTYVWIASVLFVAVCALWRPVGGTAWQVTQPAMIWTLRAAQLLGVWLTIRSAMMIDLLSLAGIREARATEFKTSGPYGWVRHPIYSGWFLLVFAVPDMDATRLVFAVTSSLYLLIAIPFEERSLRDASSGAYDRYMQQVRWKLLPHVF